jgi:hypothetical protein
MSALVTMGILAPRHGERDESPIAEADNRASMRIEMAQQHQQDVKDSEADAKEMEAQMELRGEGAKRQTNLKRGKGKHTPPPNAIKKWIRIEANGESSVLQAVSDSSSERCRSTSDDACSLHLNTKGQVQVDHKAGYSDARLASSRPPLHRHLPLMHPLS